MNAMLSTTIPLPAILDQPANTRSGRRRCIENYELSEFGVARFNNLLLRLGRRHLLDRDQLATAARELCACNTAGVAPASIHQRMQRIETAARMVDDRRWDAANDAFDAALVVVDYSRGGDELIPNWVPTVGRLDDAIVVDAAWPRLGAEIDSYLDYCRLRALEAGLRGCGETEFEFNRADWRRACEDEAALIAHQRRVRERSYLQQSVPRFAIH
ncbi:hypothetical protein ACFQZQ_00375 [Lysobacter koreensis]|uniref:DUF1232 domain-containing protein n=1 Tax=Lysobacter koreensis TaxID=266122 RepID=A0ABW2YMQ0_9GAMM